MFFQCIKQNDTDVIKKLNVINSLKELFVILEYYYLLFERDDKYFLF